MGVVGRHLKTPTQNPHCPQAPCPGGLRAKGKCSTEIMFPENTPWSPARHHVVGVMSRKTVNSEAGAPPEGALEGDGTCHFVSPCSQALSAHALGCPCVHPREHTEVYVCVPSLSRCVIYRFRCSRQAEPGHLCGLCMLLWAAMFWIHNPRSGPEGFARGGSSRPGGGL
jgi:hypothetical protein